MTRTSVSTAWQHVGGNSRLAKRRIWFVEFKLELKKDFNHTFEHLDAIICWTARVKDGEPVVDLAGNRGTYQITQKPDNTKVRFIAVTGSRGNVEVIAFKELLEQRGYVFRPVGE